VIDKGWKVRDETLVREIVARDFDEAFALIARIAAAAEDHFRRPDMCVSAFNRVRIIVANPNHAGITAAETRLAAKVDEVVGDPRHRRPGTDAVSGRR
jgi:pterin-4a-carbinolamine dehydratase